MTSYDCYETARLAEYTPTSPIAFFGYEAVLSGGSYNPSDPDPVPDPPIPTPTPAIGTLEEYDYRLPSDRRWDQLSMELFGTYDRIMDLMDANPQISLEAKKLLYLPVGTQLNLPVDTSTEVGAIGAASWRRQ